MSRQLSQQIKNTRQQPSTTTTTTMATTIPSPFNWDSSFCVGNNELNEQHKKLFALINALDANRSSASALKELLDFVVVHFKTEEDLFAKVNFSDSASHKETHDKFVQDALNLKSVGDAEIQFIKQWLVNHIKGSDMKYKGVL